MEVQINWWAVLLAGASSMLVGFIWYAKPVFGETWARLAKVDLKQMSSGAGAQQSIALAVAMSLITAYILAHVSFLANSFFHNDFFADALATSFWVWLGFSATTIVTHNTFEQKPMKLTVLNLGNRLATFLLMGAIIGWLHP